MHEMLQIKKRWACVSRAHMYHLGNDIGSVDLQMTDEMCTDALAACQLSLHKEFSAATRFTLRATGNFTRAGSSLLEASIKEFLQP